MRQITSRIRQYQSTTTLTNPSRVSHSIRRRAILSAALIGGGIANVAMGQNATTNSWIGSTNGNWTTPTNWTPNGYPDAGGTAIFGSNVNMGINVVLDKSITLTTLNATTGTNNGTIAFLEPTGVTGNAFTFTGTATVTNNLAKGFTDQFFVPINTASGATLTNTYANIDLFAGFTGSLAQAAIAPTNGAPVAYTTMYSQFSGTATINSGTFAAVSDPTGTYNGGFAPDTSITINTGSLQINSNGYGDFTRTYASDTLTLNSGNVQFSGTNTATGLDTSSTANNQLGVITLASGYNGIRPNVYGNILASANNESVQTTNIVRSNNATVLMAGQNLGNPNAGAGTTTLIKISNGANETAFMTNNLVGGTAATSYSASTPTIKNLPIVPWMLGDSVAGQIGAGGAGYGNTFVTYIGDGIGGGPGFVALAPTNFVSAGGTGTDATSAALDGTTTTNNVSELGGLALTQSTTINSLLLNDATGVSGGTLTVTSGAVALLHGATSTAATISTALNFPGEAIISAGTFNTLTVSGSVSTTGGITKAGAGTVLLTTTSPYTGPVTLDGGTLSITGNTNLGAAANTIQLAGGTLDITSASTGTIASTHAISLLANTSIRPTNSVHYEGVITGPNATLYKSINGGVLYLGNANNNFGTFSIDVTGSAGLDSDNGLGSNVNLAMGYSGLAGVVAFFLSNANSGTPTASFNQTVGGLYVNPNSLSTNEILNNGSTMVTFTDNNAVANSWSGSFSGALNLAKSNVGTLTLTGQNTYTGDTEMKGGVLAITADNSIPTATPLSFNGGTLQFAGAIATPTARTITVGDNGGTLDIGSSNFDDSSNTAGVSAIGTGVGVFNKYGSGNFTAYNIRTGGLGVGAGTVTIASGRNAAKTSAISTLSITSGATLDLGDNDLVENYTNVSNPSAADPSKSTAIRTLLANGFNSGAWNGTGGITSNAAAAAASSTARTALGYSEASSVGITGSYNVQAVDANTIVIRYTYSGDASLDGTVNSSDFDLLSANFGKTGEFWNNGDFNYDGIVNALDFNAIATNYGQNAPLASSPADSQPMAALGALVPEPASIGLMLVAGSSLLARRRRMI